MLDQKTFNHKTGTPEQFQALYDEANRAGHEAATNHTPRPMVVGTAIGLTNEIDKTKPMYYESEGLCGFAWVNIKPGNSRFANYLKKNNLARPDSYYGGVTIWVGAYGQSYERKQKYASAFASVLREYGIDKCYSASRLD